MSRLAVLDGHGVYLDPEVDSMPPLALESEIDATGAGSASGDGSLCSGTVARLVEEAHLRDHVILRGAHVALDDDLGAAHVVLLGDVLLVDQGVALLPVAHNQVVRLVLSEVAEQVGVRAHEDGGEHSH